MRALTPPSVAHQLPSARRNTRFTQGGDMGEGGLSADFDARGVGASPLSWRTFKLFRHSPPKIPLASSSPGFDASWRLFGVKKQHGGRWYDGVWALVFGNIWRLNVAGDTSPRKVNLQFSWTRHGGRSRFFGAIFGNLFDKKWSICEVCLPKVIQKIQVRFWSVYSWVTRKGGCMWRND